MRLCTCFLGDYVLLQLVTLADVKDELEGEGWMRYMNAQTDA